MGNPNDWDGQLLGGLPSMMRRINALEKASLMPSEGLLASAVFDVSGDVLDMTVDEDGNWYFLKLTSGLTDTLEIYKTEADGTAVTNWTVRTTGAPYNIVEAGGIAIYDDEIYVTDSRFGQTFPQAVQSAQIRVYDLSGNHQRDMTHPSLTIAPPSPGINYRAPHDIFVHNNKVYVLVTGFGFNDTVFFTVFDTDGTYDTNWTASGTSGGVRFEIFDANIYVADEPEADYSINVYSLAGAAIGGLSAYVANRYMGQVGDFIVTYRAAPTTYTFEFQPMAGDGIDSIVIQETASGTTPEHCYVDGNDAIYFIETHSGTQRLVKYSWQIDEQTEFYRCDSGIGAVSLGTPDGGVLIPNDESMTASGVLLASKTITEMRNAIQALAVYHRDPATNVFWNWADEDDDNLYYNAMGDRTKYGGVEAQYDWTIGGPALVGTVPCDITPGEIHECLVLLESSIPWYETA